ncbi:MAG TPA: hypothetical protein DDW17_02490 [Deltaproteobacteria bacterium]|nr:hypothetical protein [Deltaproteobacteria bacterium]
MDDDKLHSIPETKCNSCFRKDSAIDRCLLFAGKHSGIELCLGSFEDQEDRLKKIREDIEKEKKEIDLVRVERAIKLNRYQINRKLFDDR